MDSFVPLIPGYGRRPPPEVVFTDASTSKRYQREVAAGQGQLRAQFVGGRAQLRAEYLAGEGPSR